MRAIFWTAVIVTALLLAVAIYAFVSRPDPAATPEDAEAHRIIELCAGGFNISGKAGLSIDLARQLRQLHSETAITSSNVGAIVDKITPDTIRDTYARYVQCVKDQTELNLRARGLLAEKPVDSGRTSSSDASQTGSADVAPATPSGNGASGRTPQPAAPSNKTTGRCSPIINGSTVGNVSTNC